MANSESVITLVAKIRARADQTNSPTFDDISELRPWVRDSMKQLYEILVSRWNEFYTVARPLSLLQGQESYSLPSDFRAMDDVYLYFSNGQYRQRLQTFTRDEFGIWGNQQGLTSYGDLKYKIKKNQIYFTPVPGQDYVNAIELYYIPQFQGPLLDWTTIDDVLPNGWEEWVILDVIAKMKVKMSQDYSMVMTQKQTVEARIVAAASNRDGEPQQMTDAFSPLQGPTAFFNMQPGGPTTWAAP